MTKVAGKVSIEKDINNILTQHAYMVSGTGSYCFLQYIDGTTLILPPIETFPLDPCFMMIHYDKVLYGNNLTFQNVTLNLLFTYSFQILLLLYVPKLGFVGIFC